MKRIITVIRLLFFLWGLAVVLPTHAQLYPTPPSKSDTARMMESAPEAFTEVPYFSFGQGVGIYPSDSLFSFNLRFRMQNRVGINFMDEEEIEARVRRLRLRFDGFMLNPRLIYVIQLSFTRGDMDWENTAFPNIVRDAMIFYKASPKLMIGLGQTKLPGNRQRVNSSGDLQFVDRSLVNASLNVDRDFGFQAAYTENLFGNFYTVLRTAVSSGEGRNIIHTSSSLAYTGRLEILPLGLFEKFGDYFEGDLIREQRPKISMGFTASHNENTLKTGGQIGQFLFAPRTMTTYMTDFLFKYNGLAFAAEGLYRLSDDPFTFDGEGSVRYIYTGLGQNYQASYIWPSNFELAVRYSRMDPDAAIMDFEKGIEHFTVGATRYLKGHRVKLQSDVTYEKVRGRENHLIWRIQIELGI